MFVAYLVIIFIVFIFLFLTIFAYYYEDAPIFIKANIKPICEECKKVFKDGHICDECDKDYTRVQNKIQKLKIRIIERLTFLMILFLIGFSTLYFLDPYYQFTEYILMHQIVRIKLVTTLLFLYSLGTSMISLTVNLLKEVAYCRRNYHWVK